LYIQFFSEAVGGARNGYKYLIDSNFDWGQDAKRLKRFLDERQIRHVYLDYFGNQFSIEYLKISNTRVDAEQAKQIREGVLVVSASQLMRAEWAWLRESRQPVERVAHTLFVYQFP
jgi:Uri superfamily endonuclease